MLVYLEVVASVAIWWGLFHGMEHLESIEQLCKSSLQCLISTNCISLDRTRRALPILQECEFQC